MMGMVCDTIYILNPGDKTCPKLELEKNQGRLRSLSADLGAMGLNLHAASVVVNCDLPWNPLNPELRIARTWRKHQTHPVTVISLFSENTIEHRMLELRRRRCRKKCRTYLTAFS